MRGVPFTALLAAVVVLIAPSAWAFRVLTHPKCPRNDPRVSWRKYMSGMISDVPGKRSAMVGVQFRTAKRFKDPDAIGRLPTNVCYAVAYNRKNNRYGAKPGFMSWRDSDERGGLPGDPQAYELNVHGVIFLYNEAGELIDRRGRIVGLMMCYLSDECSSY